jgi:hypothetical protein
MCSDEVGWRQGEPLVQRNILENIYVKLQVSKLGSMMLEAPLTRFKYFKVRQRSITSIFDVMACWKQVNLS